MLKHLFLAAVLVLCSLAASAGGVTLNAVGCSDNRFCAEPAVGVTNLYATADYGGLVEVFLADGNYYLGRGEVGLSIAGYPVYLQPAQGNAPAGDPAVIWVTADWITWVTKGGGSGRGGYASHRHWALTDGSLLW